MLQAAAEPTFWSRAREVLNVTSTTEIEDGAFGNFLQRQLSSRLKLPFEDVPSLAESEPAMLAGGRGSKQAYTGFSKFCAAESLLSVVNQQTHKALRGEGSPLHIGLGCTIEKILMDCERVAGLETSRGLYNLNGDRTKLVLCAGVSLPSQCMHYCGTSILKIHRITGSPKYHTAL
jgi:hypothetical protein